MKQSMRQKEQTARFIRIGSKFMVVAFFCMTMPLTTLAANLDKVAVILMALGVISTPLTDQGT